MRITTYLLAGSMLTSITAVYVARQIPTDIKSPSLAVSEMMASAAFIGTVVFGFIYCPPWMPLVAAAVSTAIAYWTSNHSRIPLTWIGNITGWASGPIAALLWMARLWGE